MSTTTAEKIEALEEALASGELTVRYADGSVTYRSTAEIRESLSYFKRKAEEEAGRGKPVSFSTAAYYRG